jgi:hypothetical protein
LARLAWGSAWKSFNKQNADREYRLYQKTTLPYEDGYLDLDPVQKDVGFPVILVTAIITTMRKRWARYPGQDGAMVQRPAPLLSRAGVGTGTSTHAYGGTRMGDNAKQCRQPPGFSHEVPNLGVWVRHGHVGRAQPTLSGAGMAHGGIFVEKLVPVAKG